MKSIVRFLILGALVVTGVIGACESPTKGRGAAPDPFPNTVGSWWVYERVDSLTEVIDTIKVIVRDTVHICSEFDSNLWRHLSFTTETRVGGSLVHVLNDTITMCDGVGNGEQFVMPFILQIGWRSQVNTSEDTSVVESVGSIIVPAGGFDSVATISRVWSIGFEGAGGENVTNIASGVGIISRWSLVRVADGGGTIDTVIWEAWTLLSSEVMSSNSN